MKLHTFPMGGIHPKEHKLSEHSPIEVFPLPEVAVISLSQHVGAPSRCLVQKGDKVKVGTLLGEAEGFLSARIHSSVSGTVQKIEDAIQANGYKILSVYIKVEGDEWEPGIIHSSELMAIGNILPEEIVQAVKDSGVVGMGGATFPAHIKLALPPGKKPDYLIIDGAECEPYLTADHRLMLESPDEILHGVRLMMIALGVKKAIIAIEENKPEAIKGLVEKSFSHRSEIEVMALKTKYPQGGEKQLIKATLNREVPSGKLPIDVGCIVNNIGTAFAVYEAVLKHKPLMERIVTITGLSVERPSNYKVRVGTPVKSLLLATGVKPEEVKKIIAGGPMMGKSGSTLDFPVTKGTSGIVIVTEKECRPREILGCIRCGKCIEVCPMGLEPYLLEKLGERQKLAEAEDRRILDCMECGSCSWVCPSNRPILDYIRTAKTKILKLKREKKPT